MTGSREGTLMGCSVCFYSIGLVIIRSILEEQKIEQSHGWNASL